MRQLLWPLSILLLLATAAAQPSTHFVVSETDTHALWDAYGKTALFVSTAARAADAALTCRNLASGGHEQWMPTQSCGGVVGLIAVGEAGQIAATAWLHHTQHHKLERIVPWVFTAGSLAAFGYSASRVNGSHP